MSEDTGGFQPVSSVRSQDDEIISNILPSYHMFRSTLLKRLEPQDENFRVDPPIYEMSPMNSGHVTPVASAAMSPLAIWDLDEFPFPHSDGENEDFTQNSAQLWEKTILANVHKLDNLMDTSNAISSHLDVKIVFTDSVCQKGEKPNIIDVSNRQYKQGDYLHGYVTMTNTYTHAIPFDMVYVVFEGYLVVMQSSNGPKDHVNPPTVFKFLNMPDLFASWSFANIDRLATDEGDPHDWCIGERDPYDDTTLSIDAMRLFQPGVTYKRFFSFRVPDRLLDDTCDVHSLDVHCELLPTIGHPVSITAPRPTYSDKKIKDFSFMDTFITYSVSTKIIGKASQYKHSVPKDKYVLTKEASVPIRILPLTVPQEYPQYWAKKVNACYKAFVETVEEKVQTGKSVWTHLKANASSSSLVSINQLSPQSSRASPTALNNEKLRHLYHVSSARTKLNKTDEPSVYQNLTSYRKKTLTGFSKVLGVFSLSTPKEHYTLPCIPPAAYRNPLQAYKTKLEIPLDLSYSYESGEHQTPPEPKSVSCELIVLTVRSKKHFIPVEFNHEMCFRDLVVDDVSTKRAMDESPNFDSIVIKPFHEYYHLLVTTMKKIGFDNDAFRVETLLFKDLKSMALLQTKYINLSVPDVRVASLSTSGEGVYKSIASIPWEESRSPVNPNYTIVSKKMRLLVDLDSCHLKGAGGPVQGKSAFDTFTLVPDFQSCLLARLYYMRICVRHKNGVSQVVHVPVLIEES